MRFATPGTAGPPADAIPGVESAGTVAGTPAAVEAGADTEAGR